MTRDAFLLTALCLAALSRGHAQTIATLEVELSRATGGMDMPVCINLDEVTFLPDSLLSLSEVAGSRRSPVPFQVDRKDRRRLCWIVRGGENRQPGRVYELSKGAVEKHTDAVQATAGDGALTIHAGGKNLLRYRFETLYPPPGVDTAYRRSGFIHPLWTPQGEALTRIQPRDHYHHYGIWNPWTHVLFEGDTVDFWNLVKRQGTVRFAGFTSVTGGDVFGEFQARHEHVVFGKDGSEKVALNELQSVRVYRPDREQDYFIADLTFQMNCAGEHAVKILEYRYAGFGWRATEAWTKDNSEVLTSEGKTRADADGSTARWCIMQGELGDAYGGAAMMSYPANYNHPEPLRIWPVNMQQGRGDLFANFAPTKTTDWLLEPRRNYVLNYRMLVFNGRLTKEKAEAVWQYYAVPPKVTIKKN